MVGWQGLDQLLGHGSSSAADAGKAAEECVREALAGRVPTQGPGKVVNVSGLG